MVMVGGIQENQLQDIMVVNDSLENGQRKFMNFPWPFIYKTLKRFV